MDTNRIELDEAYMQMAEVWAKRSYATRLKVGALLVKDKQIQSDGYNGMPSGFPHEELEYEEDGKLVTNPIALHAEANCVLKISAHGGTGAAGATIYCTDSPCVPCAKLMVQSKISRFVYRRQYRDIAGIELLERAGIEVEQLKGETP